MTNARRPDPDDTRLAGETDETRLASGTPTPSMSSTGWLSSSGSIDHGRFAPGTILDNRYRIIGLLGRGGMGEVYRADDLRLGQPVALKFLPEGLSRDAVRLAQFHNEVRTARQVSHPNVCRVYDIGEIDGQLFITMEYVDGEDLSVLLRRIGRLPEDKGLDIARQICAGLAAAHERGVLHRDLKPANIMLDGAGKVRVMDFSLAAAGAITDVRAGTPAYMAPEQLSGREVTLRSDIYALGLVLYEIFTGRRAFDAKNIGELIEQHRSGTLTAPSTIVRSLDPAIDVAVVRCLDPDPARRPSSAIRVSAALPGGDPLAAALAAGETPSPEMVAAAGGDAAVISTVMAATWLGLAGVVMLVCAWLSGRSALLSRIPPTKPVAVLADRAEQLRESFGYSEPFADEASGFYVDEDYLRWAEHHGAPETRWSQLSTGRPTPLRFFYRTSPQSLVPINPLNDISSADPPVQIHGMTLVALDPQGRLLRFDAAPPETETTSSGPVPAVDWNPFFGAAGLDRSQFTPVDPPRTPPTFVDSRQAWKGVLSGTTIPVTVEAASYRGRPTLFQIITPWANTSREPRPLVSRSGGTSPLFVYLLLGVAAWLAWGNVRRGRADSRGAFRLAAFEAVVLSSSWIVARHVTDFGSEQERLFARVGLALFVALALYLIYLALEPFVRRLWPTMLVGWTRALAGRFRDPLIGSDILIGVACGAMLELLDRTADFVPALLHHGEPIPHVADVTSLIGVRHYAAVVLSAMNVGLQNTLITVFEFAAFRALFESLYVRAFRRTRLRVSDQNMERIFVALAVATVTIIGVLGNGDASERLVTAATQAIATTVVLFVLLRIGIFSAMFMFFTEQLLTRVPLTLDTHALYAPNAWFTLALLFGLGGVGYWLATHTTTARV